MQRVVATLCTAAVGTLALAGCSTSISSSSKPANTVLGSEQSSYGTILATGSGHTLYDFVIDTPTTSRCPDGACTTSWPPFVVSGALVTQGAVQRSLVSEIRRSDGSRQLAYAGHPLYRYTQDSAAHQTTGQGLIQFGAPWYVVSVSGQQITQAPST